MRQVLVRGGSRCGVRRPQLAASMLASETHHCRLHADLQATHISSKLELKVEFRVSPDIAVARKLRWAGSRRYPLQKYSAIMRRLQVCPRDMCEMFHNLRRIEEVLDGLLRTQPSGHRILVGRYEVDMVLLEMISINDRTIFWQ